MTTTTTDLEWDFQQDQPRRQARQQRTQISFGLPTPVVAPAMGWAVPHQERAKQPRQFAEAAFQPLPPISTTVPTTPPFLFDIELYPPRLKPRIPDAGFDVLATTTVAPALAPPYALDLPADQPRVRPRQARTQVSFGLPVPVFKTPYMGWEVQADQLKPRPKAVAEASFLAPEVFSTTVVSGMDWDWSAEGPRRLPRAIPEAFFQLMQPTAATNPPPALGWYDGPPEYERIVWVPVPTGEVGGPNQFYPLPPFDWYTVAYDPRLGPRRIIESPSSLLAPVALPVAPSFAWWWQWPDPHHYPVRPYDAEFTPSIQPPTPTPPSLGWWQEWADPRRRPIVPYDAAYLPAVAPSSLVAPSTGWWLVAPDQVRRAVRPADADFTPYLPPAGLIVPPLPELYLPPARRIITPYEAAWPVMQPVAPVGAPPVGWEAVWPQPTHYPVKPYPADFAFLWPVPLPVAPLNTWDAQMVEHRQRPTLFMDEPWVPIILPVPQTTFVQKLFTAQRQIEVVLGRGISSLGNT